LLTGQAAGTARADDLRRALPAAGCGSGRIQLAAELIEARKLALSSCIFRRVCSNKLRRVCDRSLFVWFACVLYCKAGERSAA